MHLSLRHDRRLAVLTLATVLFGFPRLSPGAQDKLMGNPAATPAAVTTAAAVTPPPTAASSAAPTSPAAPSAPQSRAVENAVVKVFATVRYPDVFKPWAKQSPQEISGSGVVLDGKRILTNAHVILYATQIQIQANEAGDKLSASVESFAPGIDLAVLKLDDESFFDSHAPLPRATVLPQVKDPVMVYGFPTGGTNLSITKGIVSRIDFTNYYYSTSGLRIQIDAAINPGNSGGPAVAGDKMIGLAFSRLGGGAENIGYIVPCEEIELFLQDVADGHYDGKPASYDSSQTLENPALRTFLKLDKTVEGVVVNEPFTEAPSYPLKRWDVVTKIGDTPVDDQGDIRAGDNLRLHYKYLVQTLARDGKVPLTVVREGKTKKIELPVSAKWPRLIPSLMGNYPVYFIFGPIAFSTATEELVGQFINGSSGGRAAGALSLVGSPLITRRSEKPSFEGEELVVVPAPFLPHKLVKGYGNPGGRIVSAVNGVAIKNLRHLVETLRDAKDEFVKIEFAGHYTETLILPRAATIAATDDILTDNGIRSQGSPDLLAVWNHKPTP
jgi:S1-C subfamily serine protease